MCTVFKIKQNLMAGIWVPVILIFCLNALRFFCDLHGFVSLQNPQKESYYHFCYNSPGLSPNPAVSSGLQINATGGDWAKSAIIQL